MLIMKSGKRQTEGIEQSIKKNIRKLRQEGNLQILKRKNLKKLLETKL